MINPADAAAGVLQSVCANPDLAALYRQAVATAQSLPASDEAKLAVADILTRIASSPDAAAHLKQLGLKAAPLAEAAQLLAGFSTWDWRRLYAEGLIDLRRIGARRPLYPGAGGGGGGRQAGDGRQRRPSYALFMSCSRPLDLC